jgi:transposase-like protein
VYGIYLQKIFLHFLPHKISLHTLVHRQFRKVTKTRSLFPNDDALKKMLYLAYRDLSKKWTMPIRNWAVVLSNFSIIFEERLEPFL